MIRDTQELRVSVFFAVFAAMEFIGIALLSFGPDLTQVPVIDLSTPPQPPKVALSSELPISQPQAIAALKRLGATVRTDASGESAEYVWVFQEFLFGEGGYHRFSDADMKYVSALEDVEELHIVETGITDGSLACLRNHSRIRQLTLRNYNLTDAAVDHICQLSNLEYLNVRQTQITDSGLKILRERFPNCEIVHDQPVAQQ